MMALLGIISMLAAVWLPTCKLFFYCFSTLFTYICTEEHGIRYGLLTYAVISLCGFLIIPSKAAVAAYALIAGYYPVVKHITERRFSKRYVRVLLKLLFAVISSLLTYTLLSLFITVAFPRTAVIFAGIVIFAVYDIALSEGIKFYAMRFRSRQ